MNRRDWNNRELHQGSVTAVESDRVRTQMLLVPKILALGNTRTEIEIRLVARGGKIHISNSLRGHGVEFAAVVGNRKSTVVIQRAHLK